MAIAKTDLLALKFAGWLGHAYVVMVDTVDGRRSPSLETSSREGAVSEAKTEAARNPKVYQQIQRGRWRAL